MKSRYKNIKWGQCGYEEDHNIIVLSTYTTKIKGVMIGFLLPKNRAVSKIKDTS